MSWFVLLTSVGGLCLAGPASSGEGVAPFPRITRGAYLQCGSPTSMVVRWRTALPAASFVRFGTEPGRLDHSANSPGRFKDHVVLLSGLAPRTKYYYAIGTENRTLQQGPLNCFVTAPGPDPAGAIRVWVLGDPGTASQVQKHVRDAYEQNTGRRPTDLILTLGDNAYKSGTDRDYQRGFFEIYRDQLKHSVLWPALGNHDTRSADSRTESGAYFDIFTLPTRGQAGGAPSGTEAYYSFDYGPAHFICLNSEDADLGPNGPMLSWLRHDLGLDHLTWTIAFWHHPPYSKGSHDSDDERDDDQRMSEMRQRVLPILEAGGVDLVLCGHSHLYERSFLMHGHYGKAASLTPDMVLDRGDGRVNGDGAYRKDLRHPDRGAVYVTAGSAGHTNKPTQLHGLNHPAMAVSLNLAGSVVLEISGSQLDSVFLDDLGMRRDVFTIVKQP